MMYPHIYIISYYKEAANIRGKCWSGEVDLKPLIPVH